MRSSIILLALALAACEESNTYVAPPPPKVTVATPLSAEITDYLEFTGTTDASAHVEVRARVAGVLQSMGFEPGTVVKEGDVLFLIDPDVYAAEVQRAEAAVAQAIVRHELPGDLVEVILAETAVHLGAPLELPDADGSDGDR